MSSLHSRHMCSFMSHDKIDALLDELKSQAKQGVSA